MRKLMTIKADILQFWTNLNGALRFVWQASPAWTFASVGLQVLLGLMPLVSLYVLKRIIDAVVVSYEERGGAAAIEEVILLIALAGVLAFVSAALSAIADLVKDAQDNVVTDYMYQVIHNKAIEVDLEYYENAAYNDQLHRMQEEAPFLPTAILQSVLQGAKNFISLLVVAGWLFWFHWIIVPILLLSAIPKVLERLRYADRAHALDITHTPLERQGWYLHELLTTNTNAKEIRLFSIGKVLTQRFQRIRQQLRTEELAFDRKRLGIRLLGEILPTLGIFGMLCFVAYRTSLGLLTLGDLVVAFQAIQRGHEFMHGCLSSVTHIYANNLFVKNLYEFLSVEPRLVSPKMPKPIPYPLKHGIGFHHVSFEYPDGKRSILNDVSLMIRPGEHIALVGENGAGKTSLIKLLCRLYDPSQGKLTLDGIDLREFSVTDLRRQISVMFQDFVQYHLPARENIWLGHAALPLDSARIELAAEQAGAQGIFKKLTGGYDTILGRRFEGGEELSLGEWQKIALARAFFRESPILVLDEPTSALDAQAEYELFQRFHALTSGRTVIFISHRLSSVKMVDRIYVLAKGTIVESGSHDDLVRRNGRYANLFEMQAQKYR